MKLYVLDNRGNKVYLSIKASTRSELARIIGSRCFTIRGQYYCVEDVMAEPDSGNLLAGSIIGGTLGLIGGPVTALLGGLAGGYLGNQKDEEERIKVMRFNNS